MREVVKTTDLPLHFVKIHSKSEEATMDNKKQSQKQGKTLPLTNLPIVTLTEKDMSSVNGGTQRIWGG
jgi:hypothetical protein